MYILILSIILVLAVLLVLVVLAQNPKGGGLSGIAGGGGGAQVMGVKKTSDLLEKLTWGFVIAIMVLTISTKFTIGSAGSNSENSVIDKIQNETNTEQATPNFGTDPNSSDLTIPDSTGGN